MKKTRLEIVKECKAEIKKLEHLEERFDFGKGVTLQIGKQFYQDVIDAYEEEQVKKPLTLIYVRTVMKDSDIDRLTDYFEQRFGTKVVVLNNSVEKVVQIDPESHIGTIFMNVNATK